MTTNDQLEPEDALSVDGRGRAAMAELLARAELVVVSEPDDILRAPGPRPPRRWAPALAAAAVLLVVASASLWWIGRAGGRVDTGPAEVPTTEAAPDIVHYAPTAWPPGLDGPTRAGTVERDDRVRSTWILQRTGILATAVQVLDGVLGDTGADVGSSYQLDGRTSVYAPGHPSRLWVQVDDAHVLAFASHRADRAAMEQVAVLLGIDHGDLDTTSLASGWTAEEDSTGMAGLPFGWSAATAGSVVWRSDPTNGSPASLSIYQYDGIDLVAAVEALWGVVSGEPILVDDDIAWIFGVGASDGPLPTSLLVWAPAPDVVMVLVPIGIDYQARIDAASSVAPVSVNDWQTWRD